MVVDDVGADDDVCDDFGSVHENGAVCSVVCEDPGGGLGVDVVVVGGLNK